MVRLGAFPAGPPDKVSSEVSAQTAFPRTSWRVGVLGVVDRVSGWDVLGKAVWAETEPRSVAEPYIQ